MSDPRQNPAVIKAVRTMAFITMGLVVAVLALLGVFLVLSSKQIAESGGPGRFPVISITAAVYFLISIAAGAILAARFDETLRRKIPADLPETEMEAKLVAGLTTKRILLLGLFDGAAIFSAVAFFLEHQLFSLAPCGIALLLMAVQTPSPDRAATWIENQKRMLQQSR